MATTELNVTNGTITVSPAGGATISAGANASSTLTLCGTQDAINATLATVSYQGNLNYNGSDTLTMLSRDNTGTPLTDTDTVKITATGTDGPSVQIIDDGDAGFGQNGFGYFPSPTLLGYKTDWHRKQAGTGSGTAT